MQKLLLLVLLVSGLVACGERPECEAASDCAPAGDALCLDGRCLLFGPDEFAGAVVDVSFPREMASIPKSGLIYFLHARLADGGRTDCAALLARPQQAFENRVNHLLLEPRRLYFNCCGNFFPDNLVQRMRPADAAIMLGLGYPGAEPAGEASSAGCVENIVLSTGQQPDLLLPMKAR